MSTSAILPISSPDFGATSATTSQQTVFNNLLNQLQQRIGQIQPVPGIDGGNGNNPLFGQHARVLTACLLTDVLPESHQTHNKSA